ncbi:hypothetical protein GQ457_15G001640 [Hibiscus cannabinus]
MCPFEHLEIVLGSSFFQLRETTTSSWLWRKLLRLRSVDLGLDLLCPTISIIDIWDAIRFRKERVLWHKLIWHAFHIPKHSIVVWMAILNRLPTRDRLSSFGMQVEIGCVLCGRKQETRDHIFFDCVFSRKV